MRYPLLRFVFDRKKVSSKTRKGLVQIEVTSEGKRKWIGTSIKLYSDQWNDKYKVINNEDSVRLNTMLDSMMGDIRGYIGELMRKSEPFSFEAFDTFLKTSSRNVSFIEFVNRRIEERGDIEDSTRRQHRILVKSLNDFGEIRDALDLTTQAVIRYDDYLHRQGYSQSTVYNYHKRLKRYINEAIRFGVVKSNPYQELHFDRGERQVRKFLTDMEVRMIRDCHITSVPIRNVRDLFLFQCYTGLSYADMADFDFKEGVVDRDGKKVIANTRIKTGEIYYIVLLTPALEILDRHEYSLPIISNQKYNMMLKVLSEYAGIDKPLTSHMARHTFAVFALNNGVPIEVVSKMLGHTDIKTTQVYAKVLNREVERGFDKLEESLSDKYGI